jgi:hypothetical protein
MVDGDRMQAFYDTVMKGDARIYSQLTCLRQCLERYFSLQQANELVICTDCPHFRLRDFVQLTERISLKVVEGGSNSYQPNKLKADLLLYSSIGQFAA